ncbi:MAG TPA: ATP/GTP-binding protein [Micromonosporaceae bacterium]|nr:ATP/GTP-binding protein [Micromonosporaceae bacterium]HCU51376.1 ATP/GTP-binding protein [Micromonosporaceae bacterium]
MDRSNDTSAGSRGGGRIITFYSYKGGTGRTMALANVAWILASSGKRVLAVDWDLESPGLQRYFHPFLSDKQLRFSTGVIDLIRDYATATLEPRTSDNPQWFNDYARVSRHAVSLRWKFPDPGVIDFLPAGQQVPAYGDAVTSFDWANFYDRLGGAGFLRTLRNDMRSRYDYILIDSRTGLSDTAGICTVVMPDIVVDCFTLSTQSIDGAAAVAHYITSHRVTDPVEILPVPMRLEDAEHSKLEAGREFARQRFDPFLERRGTEAISRYWGDVEIPYKPFYAYEEILAPFGDPPNREYTLLKAYERLTNVITGGAVRGLRPIEEHLRKRWLTEFERPKQTLPANIVISYSSVDRVWAEWIAAAIPGPNRVTTMEVELGVIPEVAEEYARALGAASRVFVLLSHDYLRSESARSFWDLVLGNEPTDGSPFLIPVRLDNVRLSASFQDRLQVDLVDVTTEQRARDLLLAELDLPNYMATERTPGDGAPRFPKTPPPVSNLPQRNAIFTGRSAVLESLREQLAGNVTVVLQALFGMGGVGKTQVALEYAYRFSAYYDVIWWISAEQPGLVRSGLAGLAERLSLPSGENIEENVAAVLEALRRGEPYSRWLLVYDNASDPDEIRRYLPTGTGHVLITSRDQAWLQQPQATAVELDVFRREESIALLRKKLPEAPFADLDLVAEMLGDLPLAIEQAGAWLAATAMPVAQYLDLLDTQLPRMLDENPPPGYQRSAATTWLVSLDRLRSETPAAAKLLEICAFFSPEPIPMYLVIGDRAERFIEALRPFDPLLLDPILQGHMIREIGRYALARIDSGGPSIQLHRLVQAVIRNLLPAEEAAENQRIVQEVLAAANPKNPDDSSKWPTYREIRAHLSLSGALSSKNWDVRQLIIDLVRFHYKISDYSGGQELAEQALRFWEAEPDGADQTQTLLLRFHLANTLRSQARFLDAFQIDEDVYERLTERLGAEHTYTIMSLSGLAADQRALGNYEEARRLQEETLARFTRVLGDGHERTLLAAHNLAVSLRLIGDFEGARRLDENTLYGLRAVLPETNSYILFSANNLGRDLRELGDFEGARRLLEKTLADYRLKFGDRYTETLRTSKNLAITLRKLGRFAEAHDLTASTLRIHGELHGPRHPETLACMSNLACDLSALGQDDAAQTTAQEAYVKYREVLGDHHPFTLAAANNLSIFTSALGRHEEAHQLSTDVVDRFTALLGAEHFYTLACTINLANSKYELADYTGALALDAETFRSMRRALGPDHPDTLAAQNNLSISRRAAGDDAEAQLVRDDALARVERVLGADHPNSVAVRERRRLNCDIDPPSP